MNYNCEHCGHQFKQKIDLQRHINKKNGCIPVNQIIEKKEQQLIMNGKIQELVKSKFQTMFIEDRMFGALPNLESWIMLNWTNLNRFAKINNNGS